MCATRPSLCWSMRARTLSSTRLSACAPAARASTQTAARIAANISPLRHRSISKLIANEHPICTPVFAGSLRLDAGEPHHLGPFLGFPGDEVGEVGGGTEGGDRT